MKKLIVILGIIASLLLLLLGGLLIFDGDRDGNLEVTVTASRPAGTSTAASTEETLETLPPETDPPTTVTTQPPLEVYGSADTDPANWNLTWELMVDGKKVENYFREETISFDDGDYFALPGVASFRGGNYRGDSSYGMVEIIEGKITQLWTMELNQTLSDPHWCGAGWTGQPLVVQWDEETKAIMNLYDDKKAKEGLVEAIYVKMDGRVHFIDMEDGSYTRDPLYVGMVFKGSGALDPRGYPLLYIGSGVQEGSKPQRMYVISLIDGSVLFEYSGNDSFALRRWYAFDSSPLVDAETDTLIWPGESGVLYTFKLNTEYDKEAGTVSVNPEEPVKFRYNHNYHKKSGRSLGMESSIVAVGGYIYMADNAGMLMCIDLNTMAVVWVQDILDDVNATPAFDWGPDGNGYLYIAPSLDYHNGGSKGTLPIYKLDARTGEVIWSHEMDCVTVGTISGGTLASPLLGREGTNIEDLVIFSVGRSPNAWAGQIVALDKETGEVAWQFETDNYMWSSPAVLYTEGGRAYLFQGDATGGCYLLDAQTGELLDRVDLKQTIEATPVVFNDRVLLGTRAGIWLFKIS